MNASLVKENEQKIAAVREEVKNLFGSLSELQLNWKPAPGKWSIAQCIQHIIRLNEPYYRGIEKKLAVAEEKKLFAKKTHRPNLLGRLTIKALLPGSKKKYKVFDVFAPVESNINSSVLQEFEENQEELLDWMKKAAPYDFNRIKITSPANRFIRFQLGALFTLIIVHEQRHLLQAKNVLLHQGFPGNNS